MWVVASKAARFRIPLPSVVDIKRASGHRGRILFRMARFDSRSLLVRRQVEGPAIQQRNSPGVDVDLDVGLTRRVAAPAKGADRSARLPWEVAGVGIMANQALPRLVGSVLHGVLRGLVAPRAQRAVLREERDGGLLLFLLGNRLVALLATHPNRRVDGLALFFVRVAG